MPEGESGNKLSLIRKSLADTSSVDEEAAAKVDYRHALTTINSKVDADTDVAEILEVNWAAIEHELENAITKVDLETGLDTKSLGEVMAVVSLALRKLSVEDGEVRRMLEAYGEPDVLEPFLAMLPGKLGRRAKGNFVGRERAYDLRDKSVKAREVVAALRKKLSEVLDKKIHNKLLAENVEYKELVAEKSRLEDIKREARINEKILQSSSKRSIFNNADKEEVDFFVKHSDLELPEGELRAHRLRHEYNRWIIILEGRIVQLGAKLRHLIDIEKSNLYKNI